MNEHGEKKNKARDILTNVKVTCDSNRCQLSIWGRSGYYHFLYLETGDDNNNNKKNNLRLKLCDNASSTSRILKNKISTDRPDFFGGHLRRLIYYFY